jgi:hypothetical protein
MSFSSYAKVYRNTADSSGFLGSRVNLPIAGVNNGVSNYYVDVRPSYFPSSQWLPYDSTGFDFQNNIAGVNTEINNIAYFFEKSLDTYKRNGNILANNSGKVFVRTGINYNSDTTIVTPPPPPPLSPIQYYKFTGNLVTFYRADGTTFSVDNVKWVRQTYKGVWRICFMDDKSEVVK